jgi:hypothetical protein
MNLDFLLNSVRGLVQDHTSAAPDVDTEGLIGKIEGLFGQHASATGQQLPSYGNVRPASEDRYGDPADQEIRRFGHIKPASEDPDGDPADQER